MLHITFHIHEYSITLLGEKIPLLRKEYELLLFLYENHNRPFTREEILDAVWPMSTPSDRTVDDHIYRLRKKLKKWKDSISIDTIKGYGYQLTVHDKEQASPLIQDEEFVQYAQGLIRKYHIYGQGSALLSLFEQKEFNIPIDNEVKVVQAYLKGEVWWILQTDELPFSDKLLFLLHAYKMLETDATKPLLFLEKAIERRAFSEFTQLEGESITIIYFSIHACQFEKAKYYIDLHKDGVLIEEGFYPFYNILLIMYNLSMENTKGVQSSIENLEQFFANNAYQRELSIFHVLKGIYAASNGEEQSGIDQIEKGLHLIKKANFKSHVVIILDTLRFFLKTKKLPKRIHSVFQREWSLLDEEYHFEKLRQEIHKELSRQLL